MRTNRGIRAAKATKTTMSTSVETEEGENMDIQ